MKKAFTLVVLIVTPTMAFAQGTVGFINNTAGLVREWSPVDGTLIPVPVGGAQLELLVAPAGTSLNPLGVLSAGGFYPNFTTLAGFLAANTGWGAITLATTGLPYTGISPVAGRFNGGNVSLPGIAGGANAEYVVIGWTGSFTSYDAALAGGAMLSSSVLTTTATGNPSTTPPGVPVLLSATFTGITFLAPEPSTFALAGLGAAALMILRRRR